jgi:uncharacterized protein
MSNIAIGACPMNEKTVQLSAQSLCLGCGFCCDGTIFSEVSLKPEDEVAPLAANGIHVLWDRDPHVFKQPCAAHKNCACTVYLDRPHGCRRYQCELLKRFKANEVSMNEALRIIRVAVTLKDEVKRQMLAASGNSEECMEDLTSRLKSWLKNPRLAADNKCYARLFVNFVALQNYLDRFFRKKAYLQSSTPSPGHEMREF